MIGRRVLLAAFGLLLAMPGAAAATPKGIAAPEACPVRHVRLNVAYSCAAEFTLRASNGYLLRVSADPGPGSEQVRLIAEGPAGTAEYSADGTTSATAVGMMQTASPTLPV